MGCYTMDDSLYDEFYQIQAMQAEMSELWEHIQRGIKSLERLRELEARHATKANRHEGVFLKSVYREREVYVPCSNRSMGRMFL